MLSTFKVLRPIRNILKQISIDNIRYLVENCIFIHNK